MNPAAHAAFDAWSATRDLNAGELGFFQEVFLVPLVGRYSLPKIVRGLAGHQPLSVLNYTADEMKSVVTAVAMALWKLSMRSALPPGESTPAETEG